MVSGRHKAYEKADEVPADSLASEDTSAAKVELEFIVREDAKVNKKHISVEGEKFSRMAIDDLAYDIKSGKSNPQPINLYEGKNVCVVEVEAGKEYIALMRLKRTGNCRRVVVYDPRQKNVQEILFRITKAAIEQDGPDDIYVNEDERGEDACMQPRQDDEPENQYIDDIEDPDY